MASNIEFLPSQNQQSNKGYVDWSKNLAPMLQSWIDKKKYETKKQDDLILAMINKGMMGPAEGATSFPGMPQGLEPYDISKQMQAGGKGMDSVKDMMDIMIKKNTLEESQMKRPGMEAVAAAIQKARDEGRPIDPADLEVSGAAGRGYFGDAPVAPKAPGWRRQSQLDPRGVAAIKKLKAQGASDAEIIKLIRQKDKKIDLRPYGLKE